MWTFELVTLLDGTLDHIWGTLIDFERYDQWNSIVPSGRGHAIPGTTLALILQPTLGQIRPFHPRVLDVHPPTHLILAATVLHRRLVCMEHHFILQPVQYETIQLIQRWVCSGLLVPLLWNRLVVGMRPFAQFGSDLKRHVEQQPSAVSGHGNVRSTRPVATEHGAASDA